MIAAPSIALISILAIMSAVGTAILRHPWQRFLALGCAMLEVGIVIILVGIVSR
jgi:hypothetical protein